ncbi:MAG: hypothetical protein WCL07_04685 [bacterium]
MKDNTSSLWGTGHIDAGWLYYAKLEAVKQRRSVKSLVEEGLEFVLGGYIQNTTQREVNDPRL